MKSSVINSKILMMGLRCVAIDTSHRQNRARRGATPPPWGDMMGGTLPSITVSLSILSYCYKQNWLDWFIIIMETNRDQQNCWRSARPPDLPLGSPGRSLRRSDRISAREELLAGLVGHPRDGRRWNVKHHARTHPMHERRVALGADDLAQNPER